MPMRYEGHSLHSSGLVIGTYLFVSTVERLVIACVGFSYPKTLVEQTIPLYLGINSQVRVLAGFILRAAFLGCDHEFGSLTI